MVEFIMLVGLPGSGKTTYANELSAKKEAVIFSSDALRKELFGDVECQDRNQELFTELNRRTIEALKSGKSVIYDATNINSKRRQTLLRMLPKEVWKEVHYLNVDYKKCIMQDMARKERHVGANVITNMMKGLHVPMALEGWDDIIIINQIPYTYNEYTTFKSLLATMMERKLTIEEYADMLYTLKLTNLMDFPQDNYHHTLSVGRHSYEVYSYIHDNYFESDREQMLLAGLLHDVGKPLTKRFENGSKYATYKGHDNVSAQIVATCLDGVNYPKTLKVVELVQLHMRLSWRDTPEAQTANEVLKKLVGQEMYDKLVFFRQADISGN